MLNVSTKEDGNMIFPSNERETIVLYKLIQNRIGWRIIEFQTNAFPDAILESDDGERLICEFEHLSGNYKKHGHPIDGGCQLVICWQDDWPDCPLPIMALEDCAKEEAKIIRALLAESVPQSDYMHLENQVQTLQRELSETKEALNRATDRYDWLEEDLEYFLGDVYEEIMFELALREVERQHGLPEFTLKHRYDWLPQTKQESKLSRIVELEKRDLPSRLEKALAAIILLVLIPVLVIFLMVK